MNIWRVFPEPDRIDRLTKFLEGNLIAVGWGRLPDLTIRSRDQILELLEEHYPEKRQPAWA